MGGGGGKEVLGGEDGIEKVIFVEKENDWESMGDGGIMYEL